VHAFLWFYKNRSLKLLEDNKLGIWQEGRWLAKSQRCGSHQRAGEGEFCKMQVNKPQTSKPTEPQNPLELGEDIIPDWSTKGNF
jgi:hypothetical protein